MCSENNREPDEFDERITSSVDADDQSFPLKEGLLKGLLISADERILKF